MHNHVLLHKYMVQTMKRVGNYYLHHETAFFHLVVRKN